MPLGKYPDFESCVRDHMEKKGKSEEAAKKICGAMQKLLEGNADTLNRATPEELQGLVEERKVYAYEGKDGKLYLNTFLIDSDENWIGWGVRPDSIPRNIHTAKYKPIVAFKDASGQPDHPVTGGETDLDHIKAYQDTFKIAEYEHVYESKKHPGRWYGIARVTDPLAEKALRENPNTPIFVSPQIHMKNLWEPENDVTEWEFMHSAIVDVPGYGADRAYVTGVCTGESNQCLLKLKEASIKNNHEHGKPGCGFCTYEYIKSLQANIQDRFYSSQSASTRQTHLDTSLSTEIPTSTTSTNNSNVASTNNSGTDSSVAPSNNSQNSVLQPIQPQQIPKLTAEDIQKQIEAVMKQNKDLQQPAKKDDKDSANKDNNNKDANKDNKEPQQHNEDVEKLAARNENLVTQLNAAKIQLDNEIAAKEAMKQIMLQQNDRIASLEQKDKDRAYQDQVNQVKNFVYSSPAYRELNTQQKDNQVDILLKTGLPLEQMQLIVQPAVASSMKKASMSGRFNEGYSSRVPLGTGTTVNGGATAADLSPGNNNNNTNNNLQGNENNNNQDLKSASIARRARASDDERDDWFSLQQQMFGDKSGGI